LLVIVGSLAVSLVCFLDAFSSLIYFRCPNCKTRIRRQTLVQNPEEVQIHFVCPKCNIEWDTPCGRTARGTISSTTHVAKRQLIDDTPLKPSVSMTSMRIAILIATIPKE